jgi:hypothetical protein
MSAAPVTDPVESTEDPRAVWLRSVLVGLREMVTDEP